MNHLYLFTLEVVPLEEGRIYDDLPSHLTLMSRFLSTLTFHDLTELAQPLFEATDPIELVLGPTIELGPKKVRAHIVSGASEQKLHEYIRALLEKTRVAFQYPEFIGTNHKAHVTKRENVDFSPGSRLVSSAAYLIEVVGGKRVIRSKFAIGAAGV
jgi:hypothetical protein